MTQDPEKKIKLLDGTEAAFGPPSVWDSVRFRKEFNRNIESLAMEKVALDAMDDEERESYEQFRQDAILWIVWRCAVTGGYDGDQEAFWSLVPLTKFDAVVAAAMVFFARPLESEMSSDSSDQDSGGVT